MGRKTHNKDKEWTELQKLKHENKVLRRQIGKLRKVIQRVDFNTYKFVEDLLVSQEYEATHKELRKEFQDKWRCYDCKEGFLKIIILTRPDKTIYFRRCDNCGKKTKTKKYNENVDV